MIQSFFLFYLSKFLFYSLFPLKTKRFYLCHILEFLSCVPNMLRLPNMIQMFYKRRRGCEIIFYKRWGGCKIIFLQEFGKKSYHHRRPIGDPVSSETSPVASSETPIFSLNIFGGSGSGSWFFFGPAPAPGFFFKPAPAPRGQKPPAPTGSGSGSPTLTGTVIQKVRKLKDNQLTYILE